MLLNHRKVEGLLKGLANENRLRIAELLAREPELSVLEIADKLKLGYENASDHIRKMAVVGLVMKRHDGLNIRHKLTPRALSILVFCKTLV